VIIMQGENTMAHHTGPRHGSASMTARQLRRWVRPTVSRMRAGDAEIGPNPDNADGAFTFS
jgi:hypothetical protein